MACIQTAKKTMIRRVFKSKNPDNNARIVQMKNPATGEPVPHWIYVSDEHINNPFDLALTCGIPKYTGPPENADKNIYTKKNYVEDPQLVESALNDYKSSISRLFRMILQ